MPQVIKNVTGSLIIPIDSQPIRVSSLVGDFKYRDWIKLDKLEAFLQNLKMVSEVTELETLREIGMKNNEFKEININEYAIHQ